MSIINKSLATDFGGSINIEQLHKTINDDSIIVSVLYGICITGDNIMLHFNSSLSAGELIQLDSIIVTHTPQQEEGNHLINVIIPEQFIDSTEYHGVGSFNFSGTSKLSNVTNVKIISLMQEGGSSYDVRLFDITNKNVICYKNLTSINEEITDLGTISNLPTDQSIFELQVKVNGTTIAHVKNISIHYD